MMRKRKSRSRREQIAFIELSSEVTRSDKAAQCLKMTAHHDHTSGWGDRAWKFVVPFSRKV